MSPHHNTTTPPHTTTPHYPVPPGHPWEHHEEPRITQSHLPYQASLGRPTVPVRPSITAPYPVVPSVSGSPGYSVCAGARSAAASHCRLRAGFVATLRRQLLPRRAALPRGCAHSLLLAGSECGSNERPLGVWMSCPRHHSTPLLARGRAAQACPCPRGPPSSTAATEHNLAFARFCGAGGRSFVAPHFRSLRRSPRLAVVLRSGDLQHHA
jgi:hypothetical protein